MDIQWSPTDNFSAGRKGRSIITIVDHITAGNFPGCLSWMKNPAAKASAHYLVNRAGEIYQLVKDEDRAWHAGIVNRPNWALYDGENPNCYTIGIEHEGFTGELTEPQYQATLWLHRQLIAKYGISADADHIIGHYRVNSVDRPNCPGPNFPWARLFNDLGGSSMININAPIEAWEVPALQSAVAAGLLSQMHDPREIFTASEIAAIMMNLLTKLQGGK